MKRFAAVLAGIMGGIALLAGPLSAADGPEIRIVDGKVSVRAESVPLARFLRLFDLATGMTSEVSPELANRPISVQFVELDFNAAVRKIFQGQQLDYVMIGGQGIQVTRVAQIFTAPTGPVISTSGFTTTPPGFTTQPQPDLFAPVAQPQNPGVIPQQGVPTPFGILPDPNAAQQGQQQPPQTPVTPAMPVVTPLPPPAPLGGTLNPLNSPLGPPPVPAPPSFPPDPEP